MATSLFNVSTWIFVHRIRVETRLWMGESRSKRIVEFFNSLSLSLSSIRDKEAKLVI